MSIKLYIYSETKKEYFYINEKVIDNKTGNEGIINKLNLGMSKELIIHVRFPGMRKAYFPNQHNQLDKIN